MEIKMKRLTIATIATLTIATSASAGVCNWIDRVDIMGSAKGSAILSGSFTLATTMNPAAAVVNGVIVGGTVGGGLYAVDYTCDVIENHDVAEQTSKIVSDTYEIVSDFASSTYNNATSYFTTTTTKG
jgi:hypothetical protein